MYVPKATDGPQQKAPNNNSKQPSSVTTNPWNIQKAQNDVTAKQDKESAPLASHTGVQTVQSVWNTAQTGGSSTPSNLNMKEYPTLKLSHSGSNIREKQNQLRKSNSATTTPKEEKPFSWHDPREPEKGGSAQVAKPIASSSSEKKKKSDLNLSSEIVGESCSISSSSGKGKGITLDDLTAGDGSTQEFFKVNKKKRSASVDKTSALLQRYTKEVSKTGNTYFPPRYVEKREKYLKECEKNSVPSDETWEDAMRHDPPLAMLQSLDKIRYITNTYQSDSSKQPLIQFIFPCSLTIPNERHYAFESLTTNCTIMCLELSLSSDQAKPLHVFLRPLNRYVPNELELAEGMEKPHHTLSLTDMFQGGKNNSPMSQFSPQHPVKETFSTIEFFSMYGAHIKAEKL